MFARQRQRGKVWFITYPEIPSGKLKQVKSGPDKRMAALHEARKHLEYQRFLATGDRPCSTAPLPELAERFLFHVERRGRSRKYVASTRHRLSTAIARMRAESPADLSIDQLERFLDELLAGGLSKRTRDEYGRTLKQFGAWLVLEEVLSRNPFARFQRVMVKGRDETFVRRSLSLDEVRRLAEAAPARAALYYLAATTGLRAGELRHLRFTDLDLARGTLRLPGYRDGKRVTKNGHDALLPVQPWVAAMLRWRRWMDPLFDLPHNTAGMIRADAERAGVDQVDDKGRVLDFHSLRSSTFEILRSLGVDHVTIGKVMRHSSFQTTLDHYDKTALPQVVIPDPRRMA